VALEAPSELTPPTLAGLKIFPMRITLQPDGLGELLQWGHQTGTLETGGRATMALVPQPILSQSHPMSRSPAKGGLD
jgi:hypothetical protein